MVLTNPPIAFGRKLLEAATREKAAGQLALAAFLFRRAWALAGDQGRHGEPTAEDFFRIAETPPFSEVLDEERVCRIPDWHRDFIARHPNEGDDDSKTIQRNLEVLKEQIEQIRAGTAWGALAHLCDVRKGRTLLISRDVPEDSRISRLYGSEVSLAAASGFESSITTPGQPTPTEIGEAEASDLHFYGSARVVLCGMQDLWCRAPSELFELPDLALERAVAYRLHYPEDIDDDWLDELAIRCPGNVEGAIESYWRPLLQRRKEDSRGLYLVTSRESLSSIASALARRLLGEFPRSPPDTLGGLLASALKVGEQEWLLKLARSQLKNYRGLSTEQFLLWLVSAFLLSPEEFGDKLVRHASGSVDKAYAIYSFVADIRSSEGVPEPGPVKHPENPDVAFDLIRGLGPICSPQDIDLGREMERKQGALARAVSRLIRVLSSSPEVEAQEHLAQLSENRRLVEWKAEICHAREEQARVRRDTEFQLPSVQQVAETLFNRRPANPRDLLALLVDHIESLARELRDGPEDGWKHFWNTDSRDRVTGPKAENSCRDLLITLLDPRVARLEVHLETESRHAEERRADVRAVMVHGSHPVHLPIEAKLHWHREVWSAIGGQLIPRYSRDPDSAGFGLYLVFWFGTGAGRLSTPPSGIERPTTADGLKNALESTVPAASRGKVKVVCLDLSPPASRDS